MCKSIDFGGSGNRLIPQAGRWTFRVGGICPQGKSIPGQRLSTTRFQRVAWRSIFLFNKLCQQRQIYCIISISVHILTTTLGTPVRTESIPALSVHSASLSAALVGFLQEPPLIMQPQGAISRRKWKKINLRDA